MVVNGLDEPSGFLAEAETYAALRFQLAEFEVLGLEYRQKCDYGVDIGFLDVWWLSVNWAPPVLL